jgi:Tol biopolymer transport system component
MNTIQPRIQGRLTMVSEGEVGRPRISADGKTVVWGQVVDGQEEIFKFHDGKVEQVTHDDRVDLDPVVSQDGSVIAWSRFSTVDPRDPSGHFDIYENRNGEEHAICTDPGNQTSPAVSRDGRVIAFDDDGDGRMIHWNIKRWENGVTDSVTEGKHVNEFPLVTGDGKTVLWRNSDTGRQRVFKRDESGTISPAVVTHGDASTPAVSPDGRLLLYTDNSHGDDDLMLQKDGETTLVAGQRRVDETWAHMSADGQQVVWTNFDRRHSDAADTQIMLKDGDEVSQLTWEDGGLHTFPDISDDGRAITYMWVDPTGLKPSRIYMLERGTCPPPPSEGASR